MTTNPVLYLDYDGILHPTDVRVTPEAPLQPRVFVRGEPTDQPLFRYMSLLELLLAPYPELRIVLATSWVRAFGYEFAIAQLSPKLQARVIGATTFPAPTRFDSIDIDAEERGLTRWLALDDDVCGWPAERQHQVVAPTSPVLGLAQPGVAAELATMLEALCTGQPLELITKVGNVLPPADRLQGLPGITETEMIDALEEDARVHEILRQAFTRQVVPLATAGSIVAGAKIMAEFRQASAMAVLARIKRKELINGIELAARLSVSADALCAAIESGQLFFFEGPDGERYYPAFFADKRYAKEAVNAVSLALGSLPGPSKYHFLTSKSVRLGQAPIEALESGRLAEVLLLAEAFRER
ncbi:HAD domain-containing protein [Massilia sp. PWRC2]|uniref:HAD domain-containing protein n=1 Tax=Massilia sp. PWRC2 TaxID=2804626 RepID=UPI003CF71DA3